MPRRYSETFNGLRPSFGLSPDRGHSPQLFNRHRRGVASPHIRWQSHTKPSRKTRGRITIFTLAGIHTRGDSHSRDSHSRELDGEGAALAHAGALGVNA